MRISLDHLAPGTRAAMEEQAQVWIDGGQRPPLLTVRRDGVDVSERPELWPATVRDYRGPGRLEWVGLD